MPIRIEFPVSPSESVNESFIRRTALLRAGVADDGTQRVNIIRRSIDARAKRVVVRITVEITNTPLANTDVDDIPHVGKNSKTVIVVGSGPAGYFAALELLRNGIKPIVLERGNDVRLRRRDLRALMQNSVVNPDSNYCFGEGGAGTYSDGKLYTRSTKRGNVQDILQTLVHHGATPDILIDAHPHIGSNKLWKVVQNIRETIEAAGGEVRFGARVVDFVLSTNGSAASAIHGVILSDGSTLRGEAVILATGHSARDIYELCVERRITIEAKPFALGVRIEHPQALINELQYRASWNDPHLPAASYSLTCQVTGRGVFSFCMCPGGLIVPAATASGEIVVNGMSMSKRDSPFANSGMVVEISEEHYNSKEPLSGVAFQRAIEQRTFAANGNGTQQAPAQRVMDFLSNKVSESIPKTSYIPGHTSTDLHSILPSDVAARLQRALYQFGKKMPGYLTNDAVLVAVESRTSSPVRIPRERTTYEHVHVRGLYPCGEGAGYAGGIVSAAIDGVNVARAISSRGTMLPG